MVSRKSPGCKSKSFCRRGSFLNLCGFSLSAKNAILKRTICFWREPVS
nr:MAG TPA: hypothetical protein [Caudoviricetes sp.]